MKKSAIICFIIPFVFNALNLQGFLFIFFSDTMAQLFAYSVLFLILIGISLNIKQVGEVSNIAKLWFIFYLLYYCFALLGSVITKNYSPLIRTLIPLIYFIGFYIFLSIEKNVKVFSKVMTYTFFVSCVLLIFLFKINFDIDTNGIFLYKLERAGGVYGDANNAALVCIIAYVFFNKFYIANTTKKKYLKVLGILILLYSVVLTFSTTGLTVFLIVVFINNLQFFSRERIILLFLAIIVFFITIVNLKTLTAGLDLSEIQQEKMDNLVNVLTLNTDKVDNSGRGDLLGALFENIVKHPFIGNGIDFSANLRGHNTYFGVWGDAGIFTFVYFIIMLIIYLKTSFLADISVRYFSFSVMIALCIFMISLQSIINQPYLMVVIVYLSYVIDEKNVSFITQKPNTI
jgi:hypothetical protein